MGINSAFAALLVKARHEGVDFGRLGTIGRQRLAVPKDELKALARRLGIEGLSWDNFAADGFAEDFLRSILDADSVCSIDYSDYQNVDVQHDLNQPIPDSLAGAFDSLVDGGTIEHIFDVKQVLENYMTMVKPGGHLFINTPANNLCGHGFYQFSPEFFYRVFAEDNGFRVCDVMLIESPFFSVEVSRRMRLFQVKDPAQLGKRIRLVNDKPVMIYVHAQRINDCTPFKTPPLQSDYKVKWVRNRVAEPSGPLPAADKTPAEATKTTEFAHLDYWQERKHRRRQKLKSSLKNRRFFRPFTP